MTTRKRRRSNSNSHRTQQPLRESSAWFWWLAAAAAAAAIAVSSTTVSDALPWIVVAADEPSVRVRGGRGGSGEGRGFVRHHQHQHERTDEEENGGDEDDDENDDDEDDDDDASSSDGNDELYHEEDEEKDVPYDEFVFDDDNEQQHDNSNRESKQQKLSNKRKTKIEDSNHDELDTLLSSKEKLRSSSSQRRRDHKNDLGSDQHHRKQRQQQHQQLMHDDFLSWCQDSLGIDVGLVEIDHFGYPDYLRAMEDRIDIFCDDCNFDEGEDEYDDNFLDAFERDDNDANGTDTADSTNTADNLFDSFGNGKYSSLEDEDRYLSVSEEYPPVSVRGLKASKDIHIGDVVLSIPHRALWTVHNAIDTSGDPKLVEAMGPQARQTHGWESPGMDEIPLLAITLLYHMEQQEAVDGKDDNHIGGNLPDHGPYLEILGLEANQLKEKIPHLWSSRKLRKSATQSVRRVAKGIRKDVVDLYESIVVVLIEEHPDVFGRKDLRKRNNNNNNANHKPSAETNHNDQEPLPDMVQDAIHDHVLDQNDNSTKDTANHNTIESDDAEWMFSFEKFHWAFALVNSRHWHLQIPDDPTDPEKIDDFLATSHVPSVPTPEPIVDDLEQQPSPEETNRELVVDDADTPNEEHEEFFADQEGPPAATPTDEWVVIQNQKLREEEEREQQRNEENKTNEGTTTTSAVTDTNTATTNNPPEVSPAPPTETSEDATSESAEVPSPETVDHHWPAGNSFLAPLADLLNFGPPCTRGIYNHLTNAFEIVATCDFQKGQEITFWYADACEDVFVANYGFTMPMMVHKCDGDDLETNQNRNSNGNYDNDVSSSAMWQQQQQQEQQQQYLEDELLHAYQELDRLDRRLDFLMNVVEDCHCGNQTELLAGAWDETDDDQTITNNNDEIPNSAAETTEPRPDERATPTNAPRSPGKRADAKHAIRDGGGRRQQQQQSSPTQQQQKQKQQREQHRHHSSMTRTRSRRHQGRMTEF